MTALLAEPRFTAVEWRCMLADPVRDKAYQAFQPGPLVAKYLGWKQYEDGAAVDTIRAYESALAALCVQKDKPASEITINDLRDVRDTFTAGRHKGVTAAFRDCFRWLYEEGLIEQNPAGRLRFPKPQPRPITDLFTETQKAAIVTAQTDIVDRAGILLLFQAGLRKAELRNVRLKDVNLVDLYVLVTRGKGNKFRRVPIRGAVVRALNEVMLTNVHGLNRPRLPDEYLLAPWIDAGMSRKAPERPMSARATHAWWYQCLERAGIVDEGVTSGRRMHASRHTYATDLGRATGWNMLAVQKNLGHASIRVTMDTYTQFAFEDQEAAVEAMPDILEYEV